MSLAGSITSALIVSAVLTGSALGADTAPTFTKQWSGDAGFTVNATGCAPNAEAAKLRIFGDSYAPNLRSGTFITYGSGNGRVSARLADPFATGRGLTEAIVTKAYQDSGDAAPPLDGVYIWPGAAFMADNSAWPDSTAPITSGSKCDLVFYGQLVRGKGSASTTLWNVRVDVDATSLYSSPTAPRWRVRLFGSSSLSKTTTLAYGSAYDDSGNPSHILQVSPSTSTSCKSKQQIRMWPIRTNDGGLNESTNSKFCVPAAIGGYSTGGMKLNGKKLGLEKRITILKEGGSYYVMTAPTGYKQIFVAQRMTESGGSISWPLARKAIEVLNLRTGKFRNFAYLDLTDPANTVNRTNTGNTGCVAYDPLLHPDLLANGSTPLTFSLTTISSNGTCDVDTDGYGNYQVSGLWPAVLTGASATSTGCPAAPVSDDGSRLYVCLPKSAPDQGTSSASNASLRRLVASPNAVPSLFRPGLTLAALAADSSGQLVLPDFRSTPNWDIPCTFVVPNSSSEFYAQQKAAGAAEAAYIAMLESTNADRIVRVAKLRLDAATATLTAAQQAYSASPSQDAAARVRAAAASKASAQARYNDSNGQFGRIAAALKKRQAAAISAQLAACGQLPDGSLRDSW